MRDDVYLLPIQLDEPVAALHHPALGAVLTVEGDPKASMRHVRA